MTKRKSIFILFIFLFSYSCTPNISKPLKDDVIYGNSRFVLCYIASKPVERKTSRQDSIDYDLIKKKIFSPLEDYRMIEFDIKILAVYNTKVNHAETKHFYELVFRDSVTSFEDFYREVHSQKYSSVIFFVPKNGPDLNEINKYYELNQLVLVQEYIPINTKILKEKQGLIFSLYPLHKFKYIKYLKRMY